MDCEALTGQFEVHMIVPALADRRKNVRVIERLVDGFSLGRQFRHRSGNPVYFICRCVSHHSSGALRIKDLERRQQ